MRNMLIIFTLIFMINLAAEEVVSTDYPTIELDSLSFGDTLSLDVMSWNIEHFPKHQQTIEYAAQIISSLDPDIIGLQEIESDSAFAALIVELNRIDEYNWFGFRANSDEWHTDLAFLYNSDRVIIESINEIFSEDNYDSPFPRRPLILRGNYRGNSIVVVNNHLKAMPGEKNEIRRRAAIELLDQYLKRNHDDDNLIMVGDCNDYLTDKDEQNVFQVMLDRPNEYMFADMEIASNPEADWSYPYYKYRGHLDHIMLSNELFDNFRNTESDIKVVVIDRYMEGGEKSRYQYITDHRPVIIKLKFD